MIILKPTENLGELFIDHIKDRIEHLEYIDTDDGMDEFKLVLDNEDVSLYEDDILTENKSFMAQWGEVDNLTAPRKISLTKIEGFETVTITGHCDKLWKADIKPVKRLWETKTYREIVTKVSEEMGYPYPDIGEMEMEFVTLQQYEPNARFLARLARRLGFAFWVDVRNLHFRPRDSAKPPKIDLVFRGVRTGENVNDSLKHDFGKIIGYPRFEFAYTRRKPDKVTNVSRKDKVKCVPNELLNSRKEVASFIDKNLDLSGESESSESSQSSKTTVTIPKLYAQSGTGILKKTSIVQEVKRIANEQKKAPSKHEETINTPSGKAKKPGYDGRWLNTSLDKMKCEVKIHGVNHLLPGDVCNLYNVGKIFEGKWYIRKITHEINEESFVQTLEMTRTSKPKGKEKVKGKVNQCKPGETAVPYDEYFKLFPNGEMEKGNKKDVNEWINKSKDYIRKNQKVLKAEKDTGVLRKFLRKHK